MSGDSAYLKTCPPVDWWAEYLTSRIPLPGPGRVIPIARLTNTGHTLMMERRGDSVQAFVTGIALDGDLVTKVLIGTVDYLPEPKICPAVDTAMLDAIIQTARKSADIKP